MLLSNIKLFFTLCCFLVFGNTTMNNHQDTWHALFNGKNLDGWVTYLAKPNKNVDIKGLPRNEDGTYKKPIGVNKDPAGVFSVVMEDDKPAIRISGKVFGALTTEQTWKNFHLSLQFKWGNAKWPPREDAKRDSGILYYAFGEHGGADHSWMKSHEFQVQHGDVGDYWGVGGTAMDIPAQFSKPDSNYVYSPDAQTVSFSEGLPAGRHCIKGSDHEKPTGQWNTLELYCYGGTAVHVVNGEIMMVLHHSRYLHNGKYTPLTQGHLQLQSEGSEVFYRDIKITSIDRIPDALLH